MDNTDTKKPKRNSQPPIKVLRVGAIAASVWKRQTSTGFEYLDFSINRSWKLKSGDKEGYSQNFFEKNEEALIQVIEQASEYIRSNQLSTFQSNPSPDCINGNVLEVSPYDAA